MKIRDASFFCNLGFHTWIWYPEGLRCMYCKMVISKEEVAADWSVGGWLK
jgi:hypothetical protein